MSVRKTGSFPGPIDTQINEIIRAIRDLESRIPVIPNEVERSIEAERALYSDRADMLSMARLINGVGFDGTKDITITAAPNEHNHIISRDDLTEDVNNSIIVESGSNANGEYIRFGNGWQVCGVRKEPQNLGSSQSGGLYWLESSWVFPVQFFTAPIVVPTAIDITGGLYWSDMLPNITGTSAPYQLIGTIAEAPTAFMGIALGRWK